VLAALGLYDVTNDAPVIASAGSTTASPSTALAPREGGPVPHFPSRTNASQMGSARAHSARSRPAIRQRKRFTPLKIYSVPKHQPFTDPCHHAHVSVLRYHDS
jgi:hypothetical protein